MKSSKSLLKVIPKVNIFKVKNIRLRKILAISKPLKASKLAGADILPALLIKGRSDKVTRPIWFLAKKVCKPDFLHAVHSARVRPVHNTWENVMLTITGRPLVLSVFFKKLPVYIFPNTLKPRNFYLEHLTWLSWWSRLPLHTVTLFFDRIRRNMDVSCCTGALYIELRKDIDAVHHSNFRDNIALI